MDRTLPADSSTAPPRPPPSDRGPQRRRAAWCVGLAGLLASAWGCHGGDEAGAPAAEGGPGSATDGASSGTGSTASPGSSGASGGGGGSSGASGSSASSSGGAPGSCPDGGTCTFTNSLGMELRALPGGTFVMGSGPDKGHVEERPAHDVTVSPFAIARTEVTFTQWKAIVQWGKAHGYAFDTPGSAGTNPVAPVDDNPVTEITWWDALRACNALSEMEGRKPAYYTDPAHTQVFRAAGQPDFGNDVVIWSGAGYRIPTEAEWEYAYRGGTTSEFWWGSTFDASKEWVDPSNNCALPSHPVASKAANPFGLYDIGGNVHEIVWDTWPSPYPSGSVTDPHGAGPGGWARVTRGGNVCYDADYGRAAYRRGVSPSYTQDFDEGFRVVLP